MSVATTLFRTINNSLRELRRGSAGVIRLIEPVDVRRWGSGSKQDRITQPTLLSYALPPWILETQDSRDLLAESLRTVEDGPEKGLPGLDEAKIRALIKDAFERDDRNIADGFTFAKFLSAQIALKRSTSVHTTDELVRVEGTSEYLGKQKNHLGENVHTFAYRMSIENAGSSEFLLLGRHWEIFDNKEVNPSIPVQVVPKGSEGVVRRKAFNREKVLYVQAEPMLVVVMAIFKGSIRW